MTPPEIPPPRPSFVVHVIVDVTTNPPTLVGMKEHRSDARTEIDRKPEAERAALRIRRARITLWQK